MCEALDEHESSISIGGRLITNFRFADEIVINAEKEEEAEILADHHKVQNGDWSRQDKRDDKQPRWIPKRNQDKKSEARSSGEL